MNQRIQIGVRILEERERLGLTQSALGVTPQAQRRYEKGERTPDGEYLSAFADLGADVHYILTGKRQAPPREMDQSVLDTLESRGITIEEDRLFGARVVTFSSVGMAWMLNYIEFHQSFSPAISWGLLTAVASFQPEPSSWRPLRIKASGLPVGGERTYFGYFLYLDGSPPHQVHLFWPGGNRMAEGGALEYGANRLLPFTVTDDQHVVIQFSATEHASLIAGDVLVVDPFGHGASHRQRGDDGVKSRSGDTDPVEGTRPRAKPGNKANQSSSGQSNLSAKRDTP